MLARETGQPAGRISAWRGEFLAAGREGLKTCPVAEEDRRLVEAQRKIGELAMELDILRALNGRLRGRRTRVLHGSLTPAYVGHQLPTKSLTGPLSGSVDELHLGSNRRRANDWTRG